MRAALGDALLAFEVNTRPTPDVLSKADIVFREERVAVYLDSCFWHCCPSHGTQPKSNREIWRRKLRENRARDARIVRDLNALGWLVVRLWEHTELSEAVESVVTVLRARRVATN